MIPNLGPGAGTLPSMIMCISAVMPYPAAKLGDSPKPSERPSKPPSKAPPCLQPWGVGIRPLAPAHVAVVVGALAQGERSGGPRPIRERDAEAFSRVEHLTSA